MATKARPQGVGSPPTPNGDPLAGRVLVDARPSAPAPEERRPPAPGAPKFRLIETPPGPDGRPRAPRREVEVEIEGWPQFRCWLWSSYPQRLLEELRSDDEARIRAALTAVLVSHNGWSDADGTPYPAADDPSFWDVIPTELAVLVAKAVVEAPQHYPNALSARARSAS